MQAQSFPLAQQVSVPRSHWDGLLAVDLSTAEGIPWTAVFDGIAQPIDVRDGGHALLLTATDGTVAYYAHGLPQRVSGPVQAGQVIGYVSDSGNARGTGHHLHFAVGSHIDGQGAGDIAPWEWLARIGSHEQGDLGQGLVGNREIGNLVKAVLLVGGALVLLDLIGG